MSNFNHPRALIDINQRTQDQQHHNNSSLIPHIDGLDDEDDDNKKEKKNVCTILLEIEKMYQVYLSVDEIEHKILKEPEETRFFRIKNLKKLKSYYSKLIVII